MFMIFAALLQLTNTSDAASVAAALKSGSCVVEEAPANTPVAGKLVFACWGRAAVLADAAPFTSQFNLVTRSTVVTIDTGARLKVLLISPTADNVPQVEDITRDLAKAAGRFAGAGLDGLDVDLSRFGSDGMLALKDSTPAARGNGPPRWPALGSARQFDAKPFVTRAAARASGLPSVDNSGGNQ